MSERADRAIPRRAPSIFAPFKYRDFSLLWSGLLISNLGSWMQTTAMGYFIAVSAGTPHRAALYLGFLGAARAIPVFIWSPLAGVVADALPRRATLMVTNSVMIGEALALAILAVTHHLNIGWIVFLATISSSAQSFDAPARQSWVPLLVNRRYIGNAIGLNSMAFNAPAVVGPAVAGLLIAATGVEGAFFFNAAATLAVVGALILMRPSPPSERAREPFLPAVRAGMTFLFSHQILRWIMGAFVVTALLVRPYSTLLPAYAVNALHADARGLGWAFAAVGVGGFGGAVVTAYMGGRDRRGIVWLVSATVMSLGVVLLGAAHQLWIALPILFLVGVSTLAFLGMSNTLVQTLSPDDMRGRAMSVYTMVALGVVQGGALLVGSISALVGIHGGLALAAGVCLIFVLWIWFSKPIVRTV